MNKFLLCILACTPVAATTAFSQAPSLCSASIKKAGANLKIIRSGDLVGDGAREFVAVQMLAHEPPKSRHVRRLLIARAEHGQCSIVLDADKDGPKNSAGFLGIDDIYGGGNFLGYEYKFDSGFEVRDPADVRDPVLSPTFKGVLYLTLLNPDYEPEGLTMVIGWNQYVGRYQEIDSSWQAFNPELRIPRHADSKLQGKVP